MSRFECQCCGKRFDEPIWFRERCEDYGFEVVSGCPYCKGSYIELWCDKEAEDEEAC